MDKSVSRTGRVSKNPGESSKARWFKKGRSTHKCVLRCLPCQLNKSECRPSTSIPLDNCYVRWAVIADLKFHCGSRLPDSVSGPSTNSFSRTTVDVKSSFPSTAYKNIFLYHEIMSFSNSSHARRAFRWPIYTPKLFRLTWGQAN